MEKEKVFLVKTAGLLKAYHEGCPDVKKALTNLFGTEWLIIGGPYSIGDKFFHVNTNSVLLLCQVRSGEVALIGIEDGNRWNESVTVIDVKHITKTEFEKITNSKVYQFTPVKDYQPGLRNPRETNKS